MSAMCGFDRQIELDRVTELPPPRPAELFLDSDPSLVVDLARDLDDSLSAVRVDGDGFDTTLQTTNR